MSNLKTHKLLIGIMVLMLGILVGSGRAEAAKKNASDVAALQSLINKQRALGAKVSRNLDDECYEWNSKGRLVGIFWDDKTEGGTANLKGAISFSKLPELKTVALGYSKLTSVDVKGNKKLTILDCQFNQLTKLDVSKNKKLEVLFCNDNKLTKLDISKNTKLSELYCSSNKLTKLNVSRNKKLEVLECGDNKLKKLNLANNVNLKYLSCKKNNITSLDISSCPELNQLERDKKVKVKKAKKK